jgi:PucR C-terminal helix-turn-helix domain
VVGPGEAMARLGEGWLRSDASMAIVRGPGGSAWRARLASVLAGTGAVVGRCVPLAQLPATVGVAQRAARLLRAGVLAGDPLFVAEHLDSLIVHGDQALFAALRERQLAPLRGLSGPCRDRLLATLDCWLAQMGNQKATAEELGVHHQTVRYRLTQLRELFGPALDDPASRAALTLAVHWRPPTAPSTERHAPRIPGGAPGVPGPHEHPGERGATGSQGRRGLGSVDGPNGVMKRLA